MIFYYVFSKSSRANIEEDELRAFKATAKGDLEYTEKQMETFIEKGLYKEIKKDEKVQKPDI